MLESHINHGQDCKAVVKKNIDEFFSRHQSILMSVNGKILELYDEAGSFLNHE